jgi:hypothetical protein
MAGIGENNIEPGHPLPLLYDRRRRDSRPSRRSSTASSMLYDDGGGDPEEQGRRWRRSRGATPAVLQLPHSPSPAEAELKTVVR